MMDNNPDVDIALYPYELVTYGGTGRKRLDSMVSFGVATVEGKSGYGLDRITEIKQLEVMPLSGAELQWI
jgi:imidazolonepropionase-like amidohydrolase